MSEVVFVAFRSLGANGHGKLTPHFFKPIFESVLSIYQVSVRDCWADDFCLDAAKHSNAVIILIYNEVLFYRDTALQREVEEVERLAKRPGSNNLVVHGTAIGRIVGNKELTNQTLRQAGVPVPRLVNEAQAPFPVFSNVTIGWGEPTRLLEAGTELDLTRYNTEFVDTRRTIMGKQYYIYLRAMCVGPTCVSITARARSSDDGDPSVHGDDVPLDAELINHLHSEIIIPQESAINDICKRIGGVLGTGFYSHDILPANDNGTTLFVCETGFKFDEDGFRVRFNPLKSKIPFHDFEGAMYRASHAFISQVSQAGFC